MRIASLGAGNVVGGLAAAAVHAGHEVIISASKLESAPRRAVPLPMTRQPAPPPQPSAHRQADTARSI